MKSILFCHIGEQWPQHMSCCVEHTRKFFSGTIYIITNRKDQLNIDNKNIIYLDESELRCNNRRIFSENNFLRDYGLNDFWSVSFERLILIEAFLEKYKIDELIHLENDVLIYHDPDSIDFKKGLSESVAFNPLGDHYCTAAYVYINGHDAMLKTTNALINLLKKGKTELLPLFPGESMINEMILLSYLLKQGVIKYLPINVQGKYSDNFFEYNMLFDPASWGQYIDGTPVGHNSGVLFDHHWIGAEMKNKKFEIQWGIDSLGRKIPLLRYLDTSYKIGSLHIHSKRLNKFS